MIRYTFFINFETRSFSIHRAAAASHSLYLKRRIVVFLLEHLSYILIRIQRIGLHNFRRQQIERERPFI